MSTKGRCFQVACCRELPNVSMCSKVTLQELSTPRSPISMPMSFCTNGQLTVLEAASTLGPKLCHLHSKSAGDRQFKRGCKQGGDQNFLEVRVSSGPHCSNITPQPLGCAMLQPFGRVRRDTWATQSTWDWCQNM